jgi:exoribonuclease R
MTLQIVKIKDYLRGPYFIGSERFTTRVPNERRILNGDIIEGEKVVERKIKKPIVGIIDTLNRTGQGFTLRGAPLYLFYPLDKSWPPFYVSYKEQSKVNLLATIQYEHWDSGAWPRGGIRKVHGPVGDTKLERELLIQTYDIENKIIDTVSTPFPPCLSEFNYVKWDAAFNIDPFGCEDIDDIFAWRHCDDGTTEFMIAIADVSAWVPNGCEVDIRARCLGQTLYDDGKVVSSMLPLVISTHAASLRCDGFERPVVGRVYTLKDGIIKSAVWQHHVLKLSHCFTYESVHENKELSSQLYEYLKIVSNKTIDRNDSHDWVAQAMITYNYEAAALLYSAGLGVLRRHDGVDSVILNDIAMKSGISEIKHLGMGAGQYIIATESQTRHSGLGLSVYCHATSPLRRFADLVNQRILKHIAFGHVWKNTIDLNECIDHLNMRAAAAKNLERELWFLNYIKPDRISVAQGIVLYCKDAVRNLWSVYVPDWKRKINGVPAVGTIVEIGGRVNVRAYANLRCANWRERIVCQLTVENLN